MFSAEFFDLEEDENTGKTDKKPSKTKSRFSRWAGSKLEKAGERIDRFFEKLLGDKMMEVVVYISVILSLGFSIGLFILLPNLLASLMPFNRETWAGGVLYNIFEAFVRVGLFFSYLVLTSRIKEMKRIWQYHGAEHKTIHCYESGEDLTIENVMKHTTKHPRCGTSFLFIVMIVSILVFSMLPRYNILINALLRLMLIPFVAGLSHEILKFAGRSRWKIIKVMNAPGMLFQHFTTREPDEQQVEVAITAFNNVLLPDAGAEKG